ncbi:olfactory receptor 13A1-like [Rhinoderma darwinii]|uniref:olfactory receptor 13A1-like n=1 Tax=Rhinoderma darwinii TaxID=43563 RepID=UPI003F670551
MEKNNVTTILLLGFPGLHCFRIVFFLFLLTIYLTTICGNLLVITLVSYSKNLHCPMYFFLTQLTTLDIMVTSDIVPNMLHMVLSNGSSMSLSDCLIQFFFFASSESSECLLLTVMSYDRYLAICHPLHYHSIMSRMLCFIFGVIAWLFSFVITSVQTTNLFHLEFPGSNVIDHFFCELDPIIQLSTSDTSYIETLKIYLCLPVILCPFLIVVVSYGYIVHAILRMQTITRHKAFTTCSSHLTVVSIFFGTLICIYLVPINGKSIGVRKLFSLTYTVVTPLINPIIYCLRNKDIKKAIMTFGR